MDLCIYSHPRDINSTPARNEQGLIPPLAYFQTVIVVARSELFASTESRILKVKSDLNRISRDSFQTFANGKSDEGDRKRALMIETELDNIRILISYIEAVSPAAARELNARNDVISNRHHIAKAGGRETLESWVKLELVPLLNQTEQAALLVATTRRLGRNRQPKPFSWRADMVG